MAILGGRVDRASTTTSARSITPTAAVAANHLVALMGHVETLAESVGLSLEDFLPLAAAGAATTCVALGPAAALTGPASRGDMATIDAHLAAIPEDERADLRRAGQRRLRARRAPARQRPA